MLYQRERSPNLQISVICLFSFKPFCACTISSPILSPTEDRRDLDNLSAFSYHVIYEMRIKVESRDFVSSIRLLMHTDCKREAQIQQRAACGQAWETTEHEYFEVEARI